MAVEDLRSASNEQVWAAWPRYRDAVLGFRNYWYPVLFSNQLGGRPRSVTLCGEKIALARSQGRVYALNDRCPHRGVPLSEGQCVFAGHITCPYHGWTYDLSTGDLVAALTDGPDSPIVGKASVRVKSYPAEERAGLIWVYVGDEVPPPVEQDIPEELLRPHTVVAGLLQRRRGNWRYAAENGMDEGHARYLHRSSLWAFWRKFPAWASGVRTVESEDGVWLWRERAGETRFQDSYPRLGLWPPSRPWRFRNAKGFFHKLGIRMPAILMNTQNGWTDWEIWVPVDADHHLAILLGMKHARGLPALRFRLWYWLWVRWVYHGQFNNQDQWMIGGMNIPPERLYRPDVAITGWRSFCERHARGKRGTHHANGTTAVTQSDSNGAVVQEVQPLGT